MERDIYEIIIDSMIDDLKNDYELEDLTIIHEFDERLGMYETIEEAVEDPELENMYQMIIEHCPEFNNPEYWLNFKTAIYTYDKSIRPVEERFRNKSV